MRRRRGGLPHAVGMPSRRMLALAFVLKVASRADTARLCVMDRQTQRDWVHRYNEEGLPGLSAGRGAFCVSIPAKTAGDC